MPKPLPPPDPQTTNQRPARPPTQNTSGWREEALHGIDGGDLAARPCAWRAAHCAPVRRQIVITYYILLSPIDAKAPPGLKRPSKGLKKFLLCVVRMAKKNLSVVRGIKKVMVFPSNIVFWSRLKNKTK
jgi:hypothetical protein